MAHFVLTPFGTSGDVNPFIWMGRLLKAQGHEVTVITFWNFREVVANAGLEVDPVGDEDLFQKMAGETRLWKPVIGTWLVMEQSVIWSKVFYEKLERHIRPDSVIVSPFPQFGARMIREKYGNKLITTHLQPICFLSSHDTPVYFKRAEILKKLPIWLKDIAKELPSPVDYLFSTRLGAWMQEAGIPKPRRVMLDWLHSPDYNLALFPEWFAKPQVDWPESLVCAGFPLEDLQAQFELPADLEDWLNRGDKPILFSPGTGNAQAREFFEESLKACERLQCRAIFGTRFSEQLPSNLPPWVRVVEYLPFSALMPRCRAVVHHGGIGTTSQALAAGLPQLIMPFAHDQPDNAARIKQLGLGDALYASEFKGKAIASTLSSMMSDVALLERLSKLSQELRTQIPTKDSMEVSRAGKAVLELFERVAAEAQQVTALDA